MDSNTAVTIKSNCYYTAVDHGLVCVVGGSEGNIWVQLHLVYAHPFNDCFICLKLNGMHEAVKSIAMMAFVTEKSRYWTIELVHKNGTAAGVRDLAHK
jgi:hypothetical protein